MGISVVRIAIAWCDGCNDQVLDSGAELQTYAEAVRSVRADGGSFSGGRVMCRGCRSASPVNEGGEHR